MIRTMDKPCWHVVHVGTLTDYEDGYHEGTAHYDDEADALAGVTAAYARDNGVAVTPVQYAEPCLVVECNGCGREPTDDEWATVHWPDLPGAQQMVPEFDFVLVGERDVWCGTCKTKPHDHIGAPSAFCERCGGFDSDHDFALPVHR